MTDEAALLRAICDQPDEDTPRLAYADWLDEQGGAANAARAEFVRLQIELTRYAPDDPATRDLRRREAELWVAHRHAWRAALPDLPAVNWRGYERGFLTVIDAFQMQPFVRHAAEVFAAAPVQSVRILRANPNVTRELALLPDLVHLRELDLTGCGVLTDADAATLAVSPALRDLRVLRLGGNRIGGPGVLALARSPYLHGLHRLDLLSQGRPSGEPITGPVVEELRRALPDTEVR